MRVRSSAIDGYDKEGEVIGGESFNPFSEVCDFDSVFKLWCDDGAIVEVHGWLVDVTVMYPPKSYLM